MAYGLFEINFEPNYPVCKGEFIFIKEFNPQQEGYLLEIMEWAYRTAEKEWGAYKANKAGRKEISFIGELMSNPINVSESCFEGHRYWIVSIQTGEY